MASSGSYCKISDCRLSDLLNILELVNTENMICFVVALPFYSAMKCCLKTYKLT